MKPSYRTILAESHIAAVAVTLLLLGSFEWAFEALRDPALRALDFVVMSIAILGIPYSSPGLIPWARFQLSATVGMLLYAVISLTAAWLLARWAYGVGPVRCLKVYWVRLKRTTDA
jgi:hypothetical protein